MRIKLNLMQLLPDRYPSIYWLYIDIKHISLIKQLKEKVQRVLKESRDIELCLENVKFLDEDDIHAINENEEITVLPKEKKNVQQKPFEMSTNNTNINDISIIEDLNFTTINDKQLTNSVPSTSSKKRIRKRTHKKKEKEIKPIKNDLSIIETENSIYSSEEPSGKRTHKRYKLNCEDVEILDDYSFSESSTKKDLNVTREVVCCNYSHLNSLNENHTTKPFWKNETPLKTKITKVPVFVRMPKNSIQNTSYTENENNKTSESTSEDYDILVVDWKNMSPIKITNISELQIYDMIQFKILLFNDGQAAYSSVITARIEFINGNVLLIEVLSGIGEFIKIDQKFSMDNDEETITKREIQYEDLYELVKLV